MARGVQPGLAWPTHITGFDDPISVIFVPGGTPFDVNLTQVGGVAFDLGQEAMAGSLPVVIASNQSAIPVSSTYMSNNAGTWGYNSGTSGTLTLTGGKRVLQITAIALEAGGTIQINGGDTITIPYGATDKVSSSLTIEPKGNLTNPTIVFTGTDAFFCEYVS